MKLRSIIIFLLFVSSLTGQNVDSLLQAIRKMPADTNMVKTLNSYSQEIREAGKLTESLELHEKALEISDRYHYEKGKGYCYGNMANIYYLLGDFNKSITNSFRSLEINEKLKNIKGQITCYLTLGNSFAGTNDNSSAKKYFEKALEVSDSAGIKSGTASALNNLGIIYKREQNFDTAILYYSRAADIMVELNNLSTQSTIYTNIGNLYDLKHELDKASEYKHKAYKLADDQKLPGPKAIAANSLAVLYLNKNDLPKARKYAIEGLEIASGLGSAAVEKNSHEHLHEIYVRMKDYRQALYHFERSIMLGDSIQSAEVQNEMTKKQLRFEYQKKQQADSLKFAGEKQIAQLEIQKKEATIKSEKTQKMALFAGFGLIVVFAGVVYNRLQVTRKQKNIIEDQKKLVEYQKKEITDSINYAKTIQKSLLPDENQLSLPAENFVLFLPKDIVSGDFYFIRDFGDGSFLAAVADCTGHGVPGAFVSTVCIEKLNQVASVTSSPEKILTMVNNELISTFQQQGQDVSRDGMDIALVRIDPSGRKLFYSGANRPLWIFRENEGLVEVKADKSGIAGFTSPGFAFTLHELDVFNGDVIYLFSDGYADQFGGDKGKKLTTRKMKDVLSGICLKPMTEQKSGLADHFSNWKQGHDQIDDICVLGIKINFQEDSSL